jgi:predicted negative regulator of RcsB-dependent stress response
MSTLFTREFFRDVRSRLRPGGVFAQWVHAYKLAPDDLRAVLRTIGDVFPILWLCETYAAGDNLVVAFSDERPLPYARVEARIRARVLTPEVANLGIRTLIDFLALVVLGPEATRRFAGDARPVTDDDCWLEYTAPKSMYRDHRPAIVDRMEPLRTNPADLLVDCPADVADSLRGASIARSHLRRGLMAQGPRADVERAQAIDRAASVRPDDGLVRYFADDGASLALREARRHRSRGFPQQALESIQGVPRAATQYAEALTEKGSALLALGQYAQAEASYREALERRPDWVAARVGLADALTSQNKLDEARRLCREAILRDPRAIAARVVHARLLRRQGDRAGARGEMDVALEIDAQCQEALTLKLELDGVK